MSDIEFDHVQVAAPPGCVPEGRRFYGELLGLREIARPADMGGDGLWFSCGSIEVHIGIEATFTPARKAHPAFRLSSEESLRTLATRLEHAGVEVRWDTRNPKTVRCFVHDPWGNRIELLAVKPRVES